MIPISDVKRSLYKLIQYCVASDWKGYDPFDGLNSQIFRALPFIRESRWCRLACLQFHKRVPINLRQIFRIQPGRNPKGIGLFLNALVTLYEIEKDPKLPPLIEQLADWLWDHSSPGYHGACWGYNFDWQSRAFFLPKGTPTIVNTSYIGRAFLNAYRVIGRKRYLEVACSACDFVLNDLNRLETDDSLCFSYSPLDQYYVHNATALGSSLLKLTAINTGEKNLSSFADKSIRYVIKHQRKDGLWPYGEDAIAKRTGTDSFHTGFILECLAIFSQISMNKTIEESLRLGLRFYQERFFLKDGTPKYFYDRVFPLDIHCAAQAVITLSSLKNFGADQNLCDRVLSWMIDRMQDPAGYFYFRIGKHITNKISYIRWGQAWAMQALTTYLRNAYE